MLRRSRGRRMGRRLIRVLSVRSLGLRSLLHTALVHLETAESPFGAGPAMLAGQTPGYLESCERMGVVEQRAELHDGKPFQPVEEARAGLRFQRRQQPVLCLVQLDELPFSGPAQPDFTVDDKWRKIGGREG